MSIFPITVLPRNVDVLRAKANRVRKADRSTRDLIENMIDSMYAANGVGLAAPQIGVSLRIVVIGIPGEPPFALINPEVVRSTGKRIVTEGCLSVPGYRAEIFRSVRVLVKARDINGREVRIRAENDLLAQVLEHEVNHINGVLYIDHIQESDHLQPMVGDFDRDSNLGLITDFNNEGHDRSISSE